MIRSLAPLLSTPVHNPLLIDRLEFRADLQRGDKGIICAALARMLRAGPRVLRRGFTKSDLFRWLADPQNTNLGTTFKSIQNTVYQYFSNGI